MHSNSETTGHTLSFILGHLAIYPEVQAKVFEEICSVWPDDERVLLAEDVRGYSRSYQALTYQIH